MWVKFGDFPTKLKIPKIPMFSSKKLLWNLFVTSKLYQIWRDLVESYSQHILKFSNSNSEFENFSSQVSEKSEKSRMYKKRTLFIYDCRWQKKTKLYYNKKVLGKIFPGRLFLGPIIHSRENLMSRFAKICSFSVIKLRFPL